VFDVLNCGSFRELCFFQSKEGSSQQKNLRQPRPVWQKPVGGVVACVVRRLGLLKALAEAAGTTPASVRNAANRMRV